MSQLPVEALLELVGDQGFSGGIRPWSPLLTELAGEPDGEVTAETAGAFLPTRLGEFKVVAVAPEPGEPGVTAFAPSGLVASVHPRLEIHCRCTPGDLFRSRSCECRNDLERKLKRLGSGEIDVLLYVDRGFSLEHCPGQELSPIELRLLGRTLKSLGVRSVRTPLPANEGLAAALVASGIAPLGGDPVRVD